MSPFIVGFDLDDTLYDRNLSYQHVFEACQKQITALDISFDTFIQVFHQESDREFEQFQQGLKSNEAYKQDRMRVTYAYFGVTLTSEEVAFTYAMYLKYRNVITLREGFKSLLMLLSSCDIPMFVLTNGPQKDQYLKLERLGIATYISQNKWFASETIGYSKPNPKVFAFVSHALPFKECPIYYIGDNFVNDIEAAAHFGWQPIYYQIDRSPTYLHSSLRERVFDNDHDILHFFERKLH